MGVPQDRGVGLMGLILSLDEAACLSLIIIMIMPPTTMESTQSPTTTQFMQDNIYRTVPHAIQERKQPRDVVL